MVRWSQGTRALITTTAASKFYKCIEGETSRELVNLSVGPEALLEYWPDESIPFAFRGLSDGRESPLNLLRDYLPRT